VLDATSQRGPNHRKSTRGVLGSRDLAVSTQLIDGSVWSTDVAFCDANLVRSYCRWNISQCPVCSWKTGAYDTHLVRNDISMPGGHVERAVVLLDGVVLAVRLVDDDPVLVELIVDVGNGVQKVPRVGQSMTTDGSEIRQLPHGAPDLRDIAARDLVSGAQPDGEADAALDDTDLAGLQEDLAQLGLDVEVAQLRDQQEVAVGVAERAVVHVRVDHVDVERDALAQVGVSAAAQRVQPVHEVDLLVVLGQGERRPLRLLRQRLDLGVEGQEAVLDVRLGGNVGRVAICRGIVSHVSCMTIKHGPQAYCEQRPAWRGTCRC